MDARNVAILESILFMESAGASVDLLCEVSKLSQEEVGGCIRALQQKYMAIDSGLSISESNGKWLLTPKKECWDAISFRYAKKETRLSRSALETLAIVAYSQPITKAEIESLRGVNVDPMMRLLRELKFIKEVGKKDIPGKPVLFGTTAEFLKAFSLKSISDLPKLDEVDEARFTLAR